MGPISWLREIKRRAAKALSHALSFSFDDIHDLRAKNRRIPARAALPVWRNWWIVESATLSAGSESRVSVILHGWWGEESRFIIFTNQSAKRIKQLIHFKGFVRKAELLVEASVGSLSIEEVKMTPFTSSAAYCHMSRSVPQELLDPQKSSGRRPSKRFLSDYRLGVSKALAIYPQYLHALETQCITGCPYLFWIKYKEPKMFESKALDISEHSPLFSVVMPTFNTNEGHLRKAIGSVLKQTYQHWELCIVDDGSEEKHVRSLIEEFCSVDERVRFRCLKQHGHISVASNAGIGLARGEFIVFLDHDDELSKYALQEVANELSANPGLDIIYSDEDFIGPSGERINPHFKSDWNPYLLFSHNYVSHLCVYRRVLIEQVGGLRCGVEGAQDYDLLLRCSVLTKPERIAHIPKILYHWRKTGSSTAADAANKAYTDDAGRKVLEDYFAEMEVGVNVRKTEAPNFYRVDFDVGRQPPLVTIIVPTKDHVDLLKACIKSIHEKTSYSNFEILVIDNRSENRATRRFIERAASRGELRVATFDEPFNFAKICNYGVGLSRGSIVGLVNNDIEVISPGWLGEMVSLVGRTEIGCVGAKLYYKDGTVQHGGVIVGLGKYAAHAHRGMPGHKAGYFNRLKVRQNLSAVTAACLLVRRAVYEEVGGMDENLAVAYNDVDFCLKVREAGYLNVFTPYAELYHHESKSRGADNSGEKRARFQGEKEYLAKKWGATLERDPFYNPNLTHSREDFSIEI